MSKYQIAFKFSTYQVTLQSFGDALPAGYVQIGTFNHDDSSDTLGNDPAIPGDGVLAESHTVWQHIRDALYFVSNVDGSVHTDNIFPNNITDMSKITIAWDTDYTALTSIAVAPTTATLTVAAPTRQLTITPTPGGASNTAVTYTSSNTAIATVSSTGLVTRVANGTATITATSVDGGHTATCAITCTA